MWQILQAEKPDNYVLATGKNETIRNFAVLAFRTADMEIKFEEKKKMKLALTLKPVTLLSALTKNIIGRQK